MDVLEFIQSVRNDVRQEAYCQDELLLLCDQAEAEIKELRKRLSALEKCEAKETDK